MPQSFSFGLEFELLLRPKRDASVLDRLKLKGYNNTTGEQSGVLSIEQYNDNWTSIRRYFINKCHWNRPEAPWRIEVDSSISAANWSGPSYYGFEFITPPFELNNKAWDTQIRAFWEALSESFEILLDPSCSTHIHVGAGLATKFRIEDLKRICKSICLFDSALIKETRDSKYAVSNLRQICERKGKSKREARLSKHS